MSDAFLPAPQNIEVIDVWQPGRYTEVIRTAYKRLMRAGRIQPIGVTHDAAGRTYVRYCADIPAPWIHDELREAKYLGAQMTMEELT